MEKYRRKPISRFMEKWKTIEAVYGEYAKANGLSYMSFTVLGIIYQNTDSCTQKLICEESLYTKQSVNTIVKSFWEQGFVELKEEKSDRRNKRIILTKEGQRYADELIGRYLAVEEKAMEQLSDKQWEMLIGMAELFGEEFVTGMNDLMKE